MPKSTVVGGTHRVPGDKSITHRALLLAAMASGRSQVRGALTSLDARATAAVLRRLGARISPLTAGATVTIAGRGRLARPATSLDCENSGTTARLLLGLLAAHRFRATVTGDASLRRRPMRRVTGPLTAMGARVDDHGHDGLPLTITGAPLHSVRVQLPVASAQVKSALLLAAAAGRVELALVERAPTRDHTERMLRHLGFAVDATAGELRFAPTGEFIPFDVAVPGDPSSAIFLLAAAILAEAGEIRIDGVGLNPSRTGFLAVLRRMGATVVEADRVDAFGEPRGSLATGPARLRPTSVEPAEVPAVIDEIPMLACLAARAEGTSRFRGLGELRVKESDRLALISENLRTLGVVVDAAGDDLLVTGTDRPLRGHVATDGDHRIAMAFAVLATVPGSRITVDNPDCASVSFPGFADTLAGLFRRRR